MSLAIPPASIPSGTANYETLSTAIALSAAPTAGVALPALTNYAIMTVEAQDCRVTFQGTTPTSAVGQLIKAGTVLYFDNARDALVGFKIIEVTAGAKLSVSYFKGVGG